MYQKKHVINMGVLIQSFLEENIVRLTEQGRKYALNLDVRMGQEYKVIGVKLMEAESDVLSQDVKIVAWIRQINVCHMAVENAV
jgi:hypothetical protein